LIGNIRNPHVAKVHVIAALSEDVIDGNNGFFRPVTFATLIDLGFILPEEIVGNKKLLLFSSRGRPTIRDMILYADKNLSSDCIMVSELRGCPSKS
jgi:hypothetical protein